MSIERVVDLVHYVIARSDTTQLGAVKLNKILWFSDIESYRRNGRTVTGLTYYIRRPLGPVIPQFSGIILKLIEDKRIIERSAKVFNFDRREFLPQSQPNTGQVDAEQAEIIADVSSLIIANTAAGVSERTHDAYWERIPNGEHMDIGAASITSYNPSNRQMGWAAEAASRYLQNRKTV